MQLSVLVVGRTADKAVEMLIQDYCKRLPHYYPFSFEVTESNPGKTQQHEVIRQKEGEGILKRIQPGDWLVLLDERGKELTSEGFAEQITKWGNQSRKRVVFVVGGAFGFSEAVMERSDMKLSLSKMTFSHQIVRAIFLEQLYRACSIIKGEPYHHS
ncbi:MAG: 23S rRNA (pseudouridine(1915)-N(3))-methyltransferase RlmH [Chitinophagales bacterium]